MMFFKYYRVYKNHTDVAVVSTNDFNGAYQKNKDAATDVPCYHLPPDYMMYYEYTGLINAMERAKSGALRYIDSLIKTGEKGKSKLYQYRMENYENLNINLVESNIRRIEKKLNGYEQRQEKSSSGFHSQERKIGLPERKSTGI